MNDEERLALAEAIEDEVMRVRDAYPRLPDDAPTAEVVDVVMAVLQKRGLL